MRELLLVGTNHIDPKGRARLDQLLRTSESFNQTVGDRDTHAATIIRAAEGRTIHIGGLYHIFGNYTNLYHKLIDLNPVRMRLNEVQLAHRP